MYDLLEDLNNKVMQLDTAVRRLKVSGTAAAEKERDYKILLSKETLRLREMKKWRSD